MKTRKNYDQKGVPWRKQINRSNPVFIQERLVTLGHSVFHPYYNKTVPSTYTCMSIHREREMFSHSYDDLCSL
jgi:hypothetical protein